MRNQELIDKYLQMLESETPEGKKREQVIQDFFEQNTEIIPTPNRLNHQLHFKMIISKFPLSIDLITDYIYITKNSDTWRITLVELEVPEKNIFKSHANQVNTTADFNFALNQVRSWKNYLSENKKEFISRVLPLLQPPQMRTNTIEFHYQLIIGRSKEKNSEKRNTYLRSLINESGIEIYSYDSVLSYYKSDLVFKKDIMRYRDGLFEYKYLNTKPAHVFSYLGSDVIKLTKDQKKLLKDDGYDIDKWEEGDLLTHNIRYTRSTFENAKKNGVFLSMK